MGTIFTLVDAAIPAELQLAADFIHQEIAAGRCNGLAWVAFHPGQHYTLYYAGTAKSLPAFSRGAADDLADELAKLKPERI